MQVQPYLFFEGRCEEAFQFYRKALGAEVTMLMRYKDSPDAQHSCEGLPPGSENKVMHGELRVGETTVMASDGMCSGKPEFRGFSLALSARDVAEVERMFAALSEGGKVQVPLSKTFFSPRFGMVTDRFGMGWMVTATE